MKAMCVSCVKQNNNAVPFICPKTEMPCFAIKPEQLDSKRKLNDLVLKIGPSGIIPLDHECIDQEFVKTMHNQ